MTYDSSLSRLAASAAAPGEQDRNHATVNVQSSGDPKIDGLLYGQRWSDPKITYTDPASPSDYRADYFVDRNRNGISAQNENFSRISSEQLAVIRSALDGSNDSRLPGSSGFSVKGFTNLDISYGTPGSGAGTIRVADTSDNATGLTYFPNPGQYGGDTWLGSAIQSPVQGNYSYNNTLHELGHALGLKHGQDGGGPGNTALPYDVDSSEYSVMTYRSFVGGPTNGYTAGYSDFPQTYMMLDIRALQYMYGADYTSNAANVGDTTYTWDPDTGKSFVNGKLATNPGGNRIFETIWDGGGSDTYDLSNYRTDLNLDLSPGGYSTFSNAQVANLGGGPNGGRARGNVFNALLNNGDTRSLIDNAVGGSGNDVISGNQANNVLTGNAGHDTLSGRGGADVFRDTAANHDGDSITDLSNLDYIEVTDAGNGVFGLNYSGNVLTFSIESIASRTYSINITGGSFSGNFMQRPNSFGGTDLFISSDANTAQLPPPTESSNPSNAPSASNAPNSSNSPSSANMNASSSPPAPCYVTGTQIRVLANKTIVDIPVEGLRVGDVVMTASGKPYLVQWIGKKFYPDLSAPDADRPVRIRAGALNDGVPARDLLVSPDHALWLDGLFVAAGHLVNGSSITRGEAIQDLTYWHVEISDHALLIAENTPAESFLAAPGVRRQFGNHDVDSSTDAPLPYAPRTELGDELTTLRRRLILRASARSAPSAPSDVRAWLDRCAFRDDGALHVAGWAHDAGQANMPVCLDIVVNGTTVAVTVAAEYRADVEKAGVGDGHHGFDLGVKVPISSGIPHTVEVRRSVDALVICAMRLDADGIWTPLLAA